MLVHAEQLCFTSGQGRQRMCSEARNREVKLICPQHPGWQKLHPPYFNWIVVICRQGSAVFSLRQKQNPAKRAPAVGNGWEFKVAQHSSPDAQRTSQPSHQKVKERAGIVSSKCSSIVSQESLRHDLGGFYDGRLFSCCRVCIVGGRRTSTNIGGRDGVEGVGASCHHRPI